MILIKVRVSFCIPVVQSDPKKFVNKIKKNRKLNKNINFLQDKHFLLSFTVN